MLPENKAKFPKKRRLPATWAPQSVIARWALSYLLVLLIPISIFIYGSARTLDSVRREVVKANDLALESIRGNMDGKLAQMKNAFAFAFKHASFERLRKATALDVAFRQEASELVKALSAYATTNEGIGVLIHFKGKGYLLTDKTANDIRTLYPVQKSAGLRTEWDAWRAALSGSYHNAFFLAEGFRIGASERHIVYAHTLTGVGEEVNVFVTLPDTTLEGYAQSLGESYLRVTDARGHTVGDFGNPQALPDLDLTQPSGAAVRGMDGLSYVCCHRPSEQTSWMYAVVTREQQYWSALHNTMFLLVSLIVVALLLGVGAAFWLVRQNYRPLERIAGILRGYGSAKNEFELIHASCEHLIDENCSMRSALGAQTAQLREWYLLCALKGRRMPLSEQDGNAHYQIETAGKRFGLVCFASDTPEAGEDAAGRISKAMDRALPELEHDLMEDGGMLLCLLHLGEEQAAVWEAEGSERIRNVCAELGREGLRLSVVVSQTVPTFAQVGQLYQDVMNTLAYQNILGASGVLLTANCKAQMEGLQPVRDDGWMRALIGAVLEGDADACRHTADRLFYECAQSGGTAFQVFRIAIHNFLYLLLSAYYEAVTDSEQRQALAARMAELACLEQADVLREGLVRLLTYACQTVRQQTLGVQHGLVEQAQAYIRAHYADSNLNLSTLADALSKNPNYLSQTYSKQTGEGLLDYVRQVRVRHAVDLMRRSRAPVEQIAAQVGFANVRTFRRAFEKVMGVQPGQYPRGDEEGSLAWQAEVV